MRDREQPEMVKSNFLGTYVELPAGREYELVEKDFLKNRAKSS